jgi:hypothetical protein
MFTSGATNNPTYTNKEFHRHRKPTVDEDGRPSSPRKPISNVDESFGTIF